MKNSIKNKKNVLFIILIILVTIIFGNAIFIISNKIFKKSNTHDVTNNYYSLQYDDSWKVLKENEQEFELEHKKSKSDFHIIIVDLKENQYKTLDEMQDRLLYNIQKQNKSYKLINMEKSILTKNNFEGYSLLFENETQQAEISFYKQGNKIVVFVFEASFEYFDILTDSVYNIICNFSLQEQKYDIITNINLDTSEITFTEQPDIDSRISETIDYEIAANNYLVQYSIPKNFLMQNYDSHHGYYVFEDVDIRLTTSISEINLYEFLDKNKNYNVYVYSDYNKEKSELSKLKGEQLGYIYKTTSTINNKMAEKIVLMYELNNNHIFIVEISSIGIGIPEKLVNTIKLNKFENIASNIIIENSEGKQIGKLKRFIDYAHEQTEEITLKIPSYYQEIDDMKTNLFKERNYVYNYNKEKETYTFEVQYQVNSNSIEQNLKNNVDGEYNEIEQIDDFIINNKVFKAFKQNCLKSSHSTDENGDRYEYYANEIILFYTLQDNSYLVITLKANDSNFSNEQIAELTNFDVNVIINKK